MEILSASSYKELMGYLPHIKASLSEWLFIDVRLTGISEPGFTIGSAAQIVHALFKDKEGKLYVCNEHELLVLLRQGRNYIIADVTRTVESALPKGSCDIHVNEPTPEGIAKLEILITYKQPRTAPTFSDIRHTRRENVIMVADDDLYMRALVKKGLSSKGTVREVDDGGNILAAYKQYVPDLLFLDIHMPNTSGTDALQSILAIDPSAFIVMLSADSSVENVAWTTRLGAKGFLTKPFSKDKLLEYVTKCPTIS